MSKEYLYYPCFGLLRPDIIARPDMMQQTDSSVFPYEKVTISKDHVASEYLPFALSSNMDDYLEWMKNAMITLPAAQETSKSQPEPYCSLDRPYQNTKEITISLLDMLNQCGGIMHVQKYFDGTKINFKRTYAQFAQSTQNDWGVQIGNSWNEFSRVQNDRLQKLWVHAEAWGQIQQMKQNHDQPKKETVDANLFFLMFNMPDDAEPAPQQQVKEVADLLMLLNQILKIPEHTGLIIANSQYLHLSYFLKATILPADWKNKLKSLSDKIITEFHTDLGIERDVLVNTINMSLSRIYDAADPSDLYNIHEKTIEVANLFERKLEKVSIQLDDSVPEYWWQSITFDFK